MQGIFKPKVMELPLSVRTAHRGPYDDREGSAGQFLYAYRGTDPGHRDNAGLRELMRRRIPLVYFFGVLKGRYLPAWPVFVVDDNPASLHFMLELEDNSILNMEGDLGTIGVSEYPDAGVRRYVTREFKARLHQQSFRERVLTAYREQCALCRLRHRELLDAAHIVPDSEPEGVPEVRNGLALCKLHHAAFDRMFIGIRPDLVVQVRRDILDEEDGPMLLHGLKELHNRRVWVPRSSGSGLRPNCSNTGMQSSKVQRLFYSLAAGGLTLLRTDTAESKTDGSHDQDERHIQSTGGITVMGRKVLFAESESVCSTL